MSVSEKGPFRPSPLEILVSAHTDSPVKVSPKTRFIEAETSEPAASQTAPITITNSSLVLNFNMNIDNDTINQAIERSAEIAKNIAKVGAAFIGTAVLLGGGKKMEKIKIPVLPRVKLKQSQ